MKYLQLAILMMLCIVAYQLYTGGLYHKIILLLDPIENMIYSLEVWK